MRNVQLPLGIRIPTSGKSNKTIEAPGKPSKIFVSFREPSWSEIAKRLLSGDTPEEACKDYLIKPQTIKVSVEAGDLKKLDVIRCKLSPVATQPDIIRIAVESFLDAGMHRAREVNQIQARTVSDSRKRYIRVPFEGLLADRIGEGVKVGKKCNVLFEGTGACRSMGCSTRQQVVESAIKWFIGKMSA